MKIRPASKADLPSIIELTRQLGYSVDDSTFKSALNTIIDNPTHAIFVTEDSEGSIIAFIHVLSKELLISPNTVEIGELIVDEHYRRQGIGKQLVEYTERWAIEHGYKNIVVGSSTKRTVSHKFYSDTGYKLWKEQVVYLKVIG